MPMPPSPSQPQTNVATAADYADAMLIARRARTAFGFLLIAMLALQILIFVTYRWSGLLDKYVVSDADIANYAAASTSTTSPTTLPVAQDSKGRQMLRYVVGLSVFFGFMSSILLSLTLLLLLNIMLIGRLIGISHVTSAFIWSLAVMLLVFPWQAFLNNQNLTRSEFKVPGVLYNWNEISQNANFEWDHGLSAVIRGWGRFLVVPIAAVVVVLVVLSRSGRGLRTALGETSLSPAKPKQKYGDELDDEPDTPDRNILT